jgi:hypothetical protein
MIAPASWCFPSYNEADEHANAIMAVRVTCSRGRLEQQTEKEIGIQHTSQAISSELISVALAL